MHVKLFLTSILFSSFLLLSSSPKLQSSQLHSNFQFLIFSNLSDFVSKADDLKYETSISSPARIFLKATISAWIVSSEESITFGLQLWFILEPFKYRPSRKVLFT